MTIEECREQTRNHISNVQRYIDMIQNQLTMRAQDHDSSKLQSPEVEIFTEFTPKLADSTYGSDEYKNFLKEMSVALEHHYKNNRHHPEHFQKGVNDMNLVDIVEMICDWKAATLRHNDGDLLRSIEINSSRFGYDDQLKQILINTANMISELESSVESTDKCDANMPSKVEEAVYILEFIKQQYAKNSQAAGITKYVDALQLAIDSLRNIKHQR